MKFLEVKEIFNHPVLTRGKNEVFRKIITGENTEECFKKLYDLDRATRYNNYKFIEIEDLEVKKAYQIWKRKITIEIYYGNGIVD